MRRDLKENLEGKAIELVLESGRLFTLTELAENGYELKRDKMKKRIGCFEMVFVKTNTNLYKFGALINYDGFER